MKRLASLSLAAHFSLLALAGTLYFMRVESNPVTRLASVLLGVLFVFLLFTKSSKVRGDRFPLWLRTYYWVSLMGFFLIFNLIGMNESSLPDAYFSFMLLGFAIPFAMMLRTETR